MGFESGVLSFGSYYLARDLPGEAVRRFAEHALPPIEELGREPIHGWVTGRHLLDRHITEETARVAGRLRLSLVKAERKIPEPLLRAECRMEELAILSAEDRDFLDRQTRVRIKKEVTERLLPAMPPTLTGIPIACGRDDRLLYAGATSDKQADALTLAFRQATDVNLIPLTPEAAAMKRKRVSVGDLPPSSYSPECADALAGQSVGMDFLTWLWFFFEEQGGLLTIGAQRYGAMLEGPLTFFMEGDGAHVTVLRNGRPLVSSEAKTALLAGKKLRAAKVLITRGEETWSATVDAASFVFRGCRLPKTEALDPVSRFEERMLSLERFQEAFFCYFDRFIEERTDPARWEMTQQAIHGWVTRRTGRA